MIRQRHRKSKHRRCPHPTSKGRWDRVKDSTGCHLYKLCKACGRIVERRRCP